MAGPEFQILDDPTSGPGRYIVVERADSPLRHDHTIARGLSLDQAEQVRDYMIDVAPTIYGGSPDPQEAA